MDDDHADDLLRRALIDAERPPRSRCGSPLSLSETLTVVFHGRRDLGTIQTYVANGGRGAGDSVGARDLLRVPVRPRPRPRPTIARRPSTCSPSRPVRCATRWSAADTVLDIWREPLRGPRRRPTSRVDRSDRPRRPRCPPTA